MIQMHCPLKMAAQKIPTQIALVSGTTTIRYAQLDRYVDSTANQLRNLKLKEKNHIAIVSPNSIEYLIALLASWRIGVITVLLSTRLPNAVIQQQSQNIGCQRLFTGDERILRSKRVSAKKFKLSEIVCRNNKNHNLKGTSKISLEQEATIMYTSGSTAEPKAVVHTYGNHYYNALGSNENIPLHVDDRWLLCLPLYHVAGLSVLFRTMLAGATSVISQKNEEISIAIKQYGITHISLVPAQLYRLLQTEKNIPLLKNLKAILLGGGPIPENIFKLAARYHLPLFATYGLTEMTSQIATTTKQDMGRGRFIPLKILKYSRIKISNDGEILVKGKTLFQGYRKKSSIQRPLTRDGWFRTGDLGKINRNGYLWVSGRKDNMFISGGENIQPEEIERKILLFRHIEQAIVVPQPDEKFGFRPVVFIKAKSEQRLNINRLKSYLEKFLPRFKIPETFYQWPEEIQSDGLKINRNRFKEWLKEKEDIKRIR